MKPLLNWKHEATMRMGASVKVTAKAGSKRRGQQYHRRIYKELSALLRDDESLRLLIEPWYRCTTQPAMRSPDAVILLPDSDIGIVVEVKLNWKDGRDIKLVDEYVPIVNSAHKLEMTWPLLITQCLRGCKTKPLLGLRRWEDAMTWQPGDPTPVMLVP